MSNFLGKVIDFVFKLSPYDTEYTFKNHVVIVGGISDLQLIDFLEEVAKNDEVDALMNQS